MLVANQKLDKAATTADDNDDKKCLDEEEGELDQSTGTRVVCLDSIRKSHLVVLNKESWNFHKTIKNKLSAEKEKHVYTKRQISSLFLLLHDSPETFNRSKKNMQEIISLLW